MTRHPDRVAALALLVVALMLFAPVLAQPGGLVYPPRSDFTDLTITHWPNVAFAVESLRVTGRLPLWRPTIMSGTPFAANPLSGLFYLPHVIFLVVPLAVGFNVLFIAHVWWTGCAAYALLRAWQIGRPAAFVGALTWMATPKLFAHLGAGHVGMVEAIAWLPLAVLAVHRVTHHRSVKDAAWLGAVWAVQFLADPRISFYSVALTLTYLAFQSGVNGLRRNSPHSSPLPTEGRAHTLGEMPLLERRASDKVTTLLLGLLALLAFAVLSTVLWLPFTEFIMQSNRGGLTLPEAGEWSLPVRQLAGVLLADWGGFHEWMVYVGILPFVLAICAAYYVLYNQTARMRSAQYVIVVVWLILCLIVAALFALGINGPLFPFLFRFVPGLGLLRVPPRAWFIVAFAMACLCAFGIEGMMREARTPRRWVTLTGVALAAFALLFGWGGFFLLQANPQAGSARAAMLHLALVAPASVAIVLLRAHGRIGAREFVSASAAVIVATLLPVDLSLYRVVPEAQAFSDHADVAEWLAKQAQPDTFRVYSPSYSLPQHLAQRAGLELADGVDPMQVASYARLMETVTGARTRGYSVTIPSFPPNSDVRTALRDAKPDMHLLGLLNVRYVVAEFPINAEGLVEQTHIGSTYVYENLWVMPRAFVGATSARVTVNTPDHIVVEADGPGTLTLSQVNYPGWRVTVDGRATTPDPTGSSSLLGFDVSLDAGHHVIEFVFDPWTVKVGVLVSTVGWSGLLVATILARALKTLQGFKGQQWDHAGA